MKNYFSWTGALIGTLLACVVVTHNANKTIKDKDIAIVALSAQHTKDAKQISELKASLESSVADTAAAKLDISACKSNLDDAQAKTVACPGPCGWSDCRQLSAVLSYCSVSVKIIEDQKKMADLQNQIDANNKQIAINTDKALKNIDKSLQDMEKNNAP